MKIRDRYTRGVTGSGTTRPRGKLEGCADVTRSSLHSDCLHISDRGLEIRRARSLACSAPDIRIDLVDVIVQQIERGEYTVTGADVAPRMIRDHLAMVGR